MVLPPNSSSKLWPISPNNVKTFELFLLSYFTIRKPIYRDSCIFLLFQQKHEFEDTIYVELYLLIAFVDF